MSEEELAITKKYLDKHLLKGFIRPLSLLATTLVSLVYKPRGGLYFYVDY